MQTGQKMSVSEWLENYWYHYKWPTILGVFFLFVFLVGVVQCSTRVQADVILMYSGPQALSLDSVRELESSAADVLAHDCNGDGKTYVQYLENIVLFDDYTVEDLNGEQQIVINKSEQIESYVTQVAAGDAQIFLLSPDVYKELSKQNVLTPLTEVFGSVPVEANDVCSYELGRLGIYTLPGFRELPSDTVVCLRVQKTLAVIHPEEARAEHEWAAELFRAMIEYLPQ